MRLLSRPKPGISPVICLLLAVSGAQAWSVPAPPAAVPGQESMEESLFRDLEWRNIGPANMAGRVTDIEAVDANFATVFVAAASGGVWKSTNAGTTWDPIFTDYGTSNIGDIALFQPNPDIVWVGTGESCTRNSIGWGDGVYKSTDGGATFTNVGLADTHHIGEVLTHPTDPDIAYVAAQGHLWGYTGDRGLFRTTDGGATWTKLGTDAPVITDAQAGGSGRGGLPNDNRTGATDMVMDSRDPDVLYVSFWHRLRQPHRFDSGGSNGGIYKSTDGGDSWLKLTDGLPEGDTGKIGLAISRSNPDTLMAIVEHGFQPQRRNEDDSENPDYDDMSKLGTGIYRSDDGGDSWEYVSRYNNRPFYYSHIWMNPVNDDIVYVVAGSAQISVDGGPHVRAPDAGNFRRLPRPVGKSGEPGHFLCRQRQGLVHHLRPRLQLPDVRQHGPGPVLRRHRRHAGSVLGVRGAPGQRQLGRPKQQSRLERHPQRPLVQVSQRRRLPHHGGPE